MNLKHLDRIKQPDEGYTAPLAAIPICFRQMDLHKKEIEATIGGVVMGERTHVEDFPTSSMVSDRDGSQGPRIFTHAIIIAIHPCKRLAARCVELFNTLPEVLVWVLGFQD